jgi:hypothetical protein
MAASLVVRLHNTVSFAAVLERTSAVLCQLMGLESVPKLLVELPPAHKNESLEGASIDVNFPGAYITLQEIEHSLATFLVFNSPVGNVRTRLLVGCSAEGRTPESEVLVAALAVATSELVQGSIDDAGHHWLGKDEYSAQELVESLREQEQRSDLHSAAEAAYHRQSAHRRNTNRESGPQG